MKDEGHVGELDWFTLDVLALAEAERWREKQRRLIEGAKFRIPGPLVRTMWDAISTSRRLHVKYLRSTYGYDPLRYRWRRKSSPPTSEFGWLMFWHSVREVRRANLLFGALLDGGYEAMEAGQLSAPAVVVDRVMAADRMLAWLDGCDTMMAPWPLVRCRAAAYFCGTLLGRVSLSLNSHLRASLSRGSRRDQEVELAVRFPGAVLEALKAGGPHEHPNTVRNRAVRLLECEARPRRQYRPRRGRLDGAPAPWPTMPEFDPFPVSLDLLAAGFDPSVIDEVHRENGWPSMAELLERRTRGLEELLRHRAESVSLPEEVRPMEDFANREEASHALAGAPIDADLLEAAADLARRHGLTPRQAEVFLLKKGARLKHAQIAERLGIAVGTSKKHYYEVRRKLGA